MSYLESAHRADREDLMGRVLRSIDDGDGDDDEAESDDDEGGS